MDIFHEIRFLVDDVEITTDWPILTLQRILELAGKTGFRLKNMDSGVEYEGFHHEIFLRQGMKFQTPSGPRHTYEAGMGRR